jgi:predicted metal-dependent phosphoesterase TrpH
MAPSFSIAHVTPYPWEDQENEVNAHVREVCAELARRGHRVLVLAPSRSHELVRSSRRALRSARAGGSAGRSPIDAVESLLAGSKSPSPRVLAVGEVLDVPSSTRRRPSALPIDVARTVEEALTTLELDFVHVHEPFAPSTSSAALRHSRALNVGSFHVQSERLLSTLLARRFVESLFGRLDARTASTAATAAEMARHFPGEYRLIPDGPRAAEECEAIYRELDARRHAAVGDPAIERRLRAHPLIDVDLHMHTDHSWDCATPIEVLLASARSQGLGAIAVTDHNEISGALAARTLSEQNGTRAGEGNGNRDGNGNRHVKVIVGEEVKTAEQGEVIGLFIEEKIPRGLTLAETIAEIKRQGGLVYVPHPFDRMHSVPDYEHLLPVIDQIDLIEVFNSRVAINAFNEEAERFAAKYRIPAGAGSDSHVAQGLGSARLRMLDFDGPAEFMQSLRSAEIVTRPSSLLYVQALKFLQTRARPASAQRASRSRRVRRLRRAGEGRGRR